MQQKNVFVVLVCMFFFGSVFTQQPRSELEAEISKKAQEALDKIKKENEEIKANRQSSGTLSKNQFSDTEFVKAGRVERFEIKSEDITKKKSKSSSQKQIIVIRLNSGKTLNIVYDPASKTMPKLIKNRKKAEIKDILHADDVLIVNPSDVPKIAGYKIEKEGEVPFVVNEKTTIYFGRDAIAKMDQMKPKPEAKPKPKANTKSKPAPKKK